MPTYYGGKNGDPNYQVVNSKTGLYKGAQDFYNAYNHQIANGTNDISKLNYYNWITNRFGLANGKMSGAAWHNMSIQALSGDKKSQAYLKAMHLQGQTAKQGLWAGMKAGQLDANQSLRDAYINDNPYTHYTQGAQMKSYNTYNDMIMNNKPMTDGQQAYYNQIIGKWNLKDMNDTYNQQIYQQQQDKQNALNAQDVAFNSAQVGADKASYQNMQDMKQTMANNGMSDSGIASDAYNQANAQNHAAFAQAYADSQAKKADITNQADGNIANIQQAQLKNQQDQAAAAQQAQLDLMNAQNKQDQFMTSQTGYVYMNGKLVTQGGQPLRTLDYYKMTETQRHNIATENNASQGNQIKEDSLTAQMNHWANQDKYNNDLLQFKGQQLNEKIKADSEKAQLGRDQLSNSKDRQRYDFYNAQLKSADSHITSLQNKKNPTDADKAALADWNSKRNAALQGMGNVFGSSGFNDGGGGGDTPQLSGSGTAEKIFNYLTSQGISAGAAAGIMGNMQQENSLSTADNSGGMGLVQWIGGRRNAEIKYANQHGVSPTSLEAQLGYLMKELSSGSGGLRVSDLNRLGASDAAQLFSDKFERPNAKYANNNKRKGYANQFYKLYGSKAYNQGY